MVTHSKILIMRLFLLFTILPALVINQLVFPGQESITTSEPSSRPTKRTTSRPSTRCGRRITVPKPAQFVIGGKPAQVGQFPWAVLALRSDGSSCGGSLLSERFVLSAAHCHEEGVRITRVRVGVTRVEGGEQDTYRVRGRRGNSSVGDPQLVEVSRAIVHPGYAKDKHGVTLNDLVLLELKTPVKFGPLVQPICLAAGEGLNRGASTVMGWGVANKNDLSSPHVASQNHLQWVNLDILSDSECTEAYKKLKPAEEDSGIRLNPAIHLCAGRQVGVDSCSGDSGGPLVARTGYGRRARSYLVGVVSGGPECAMGFAGYYAKMSSYVQWVNQYL